MWNGCLWTSSGRDRLTEPGPHAVVVDAAGHHVDQHLVLADRPGRQHLDLHRGFGRAMALLADRPGVHGLRHVAERRDLADLVEVLAAPPAAALLCATAGIDVSRNEPQVALRILAHLMLHRNNENAIGPSAPFRATVFDRLRYTTLVECANASRGLSLSPPGGGHHARRSDRVADSGRGCRLARRPDREGLRLRPARQHHRRHCRRTASPAGCCRNSASSISAASPDRSSMP